MAYSLWIENRAKSEMRKLPGHFRQRILRVVNSLADDPRPSSSQELRSPPEGELAVEARRIRLDEWRVVYVVDDEWEEAGVLAVRKRPPYDYDDLPELLSDL